MAVTQLAPGGWLVSLSPPLMLLILLGISCAPGCAGYSVLAHEAVIDAAWKTALCPCS